MLCGVPEVAVSQLLVGGRELALLEDGGEPHLGPLIVILGEITQPGDPGPCARLDLRQRDTGIGLDLGHAQRRAHIAAIGGDAVEGSRLGEVAGLGGAFLIGPAQGEARRGHTLVQRHSVEVLGLGPVLGHAFPVGIEAGQGEGRVAAPGPGRAGRDLIVVGGLGRIPGHAAASAVEAGELEGGCRMARVLVDAGVGADRSLIVAAPGCVQRHLHVGRVDVVQFPIRGRRQPTGPAAGEGREGEHARHGRDAKPRTHPPTPERRAGTAGRGLRDPRLS